MKSQKLALMIAAVCVTAVGCQPNLEVSLAAKPSYDEGEVVGPTVDAKVSNSGNAKALGTNDDPDNGFMVDLVLSSDATVPVAFATVPTPYTFQEDMLLEGGRISKTDTLAGGASQTYSGHGGAIPPGAPANAFLCAVVDPGLKVKESDEADNTSCVEVRIVPKASMCCNPTGPVAFNCASLENLGPGADLDGRCNQVNQGQSCSWDYSIPTCCAKAINDGFPGTVTCQ